jgi:hypothetical protein
LPFDIPHIKQKDSLRSDFGDMRSLSTLLFGAKKLEGEHPK